jgi:hypothetical protein
VEIDQFGHRVRDVWLHGCRFAECVAAYLARNLRRAAELADRSYEEAAVAQSPMLAGAWAALGGLVAGGDRPARGRRSASAVAVLPGRAGRLLCADLPWLELRNAWRLVGGGRLTEATSAARRAAELAGDGGQSCVELMARYDLARCVPSPSPESGRLSELAVAIGGDVARAAYGPQERAGRLLARTLSSREIAAELGCR